MGTDNEITNVSELEEYVKTMLTDIAIYANQNEFEIQYEYIDLGTATIDLYFLEHNFVMPNKKQRKKIYESCIEHLFDKYCC